MSSCHGCASGFGFLKKELGCPKCGFSFCKKCLRFKILDQKTSKEILVCHRCQKLTTSSMDPEEPPIITNALLKLEAMENPARPPITVYKQHAREARLAQLKKGLSVEDRELAERLESLRKPDEQISSDVPKRRSSEQIAEEIEARLARLKGEESVKRESSMLGKSKPETDVDLINKFSDEVKLDEDYKTKMVGDIEERLAKLRGESSTTSADGQQGTSRNMEFEENISEEEQIQRIISRYKAEVELESKIPVPESSESDPKAGPAEAVQNIPVSSDEDNEEDLDNLCRICDEKRATLKCEECDGDLFCKKCFDELHLELGEVHKPTPFKGKR